MNVCADVLCPHPHPRPHPAFKRIRALSDVVVRPSARDNVQESTCDEFCFRLFLVLFKTGKGSVRKKTYANIKL